MMIDGCLAWERKDTTLEFSLLEQGRLMSGARAVHTKVMSGLGLRWAEFILSCCSERRLGVGSLFTLIFPLPWSYWLLELSCFCFLSGTLLLMFPFVVGRGSGVGMISTRRMRSVLEGTGSIPTVLYGARHSWLSINYKRYDPPLQHQKEEEHI